MNPRSTDLATLAITSPESVSTRPGDEQWVKPTSGRTFERTVEIGTGLRDPRSWAELREAVMRWAVKRRSGFEVDSSLCPAALGNRGRVQFRVGPVVIVEPVEVVSIVDTDDRVGFAYATLNGHPLAGEECFVVHRDVAGRGFLTLRSVVPPAPSGAWRYGFPALRVAQRWFRRRYFRALSAWA